MKRQHLGLVVLVIGAVLLVLSLAADVLRPGGSPGFGFLQWAGAILGFVLLVAGGLVSRGTPRGAPPG